MRNTKEILKRGYSRISFLTKLKYAGVKTEDLIEMYELFIRSCAEYCSVAFHSSLTLAESQSLERLQSTCLKVILQDNYIGYAPACEMSGLQTLFDRRQSRMLVFSKKCLEHPLNSRMFTYNEQYNVDPHIRDRELFKVNFSHGEKYKNSAIPSMQRLLNSHYSQKREEGD